jgi:hypothetical protein
MQENDGWNGIVEACDAFIQQEVWGKGLWAHMQQLRRRRQVSLHTTAPLGAGTFALVGIQSSGCGIACLIQTIHQGCISVEGLDVRGEQVFSVMAAGWFCEKSG